MHAEALTWAICAAAGGAGKGQCDPEHCGCAGQAREIIKALDASGHQIVRFKRSVRAPFQIEDDDLKRT